PRAPRGTRAGPAPPPPGRGRSARPSRGTSGTTPRPRRAAPAGAPPPRGRGRPGTTASRRSRTREPASRSRLTSQAPEKTGSAWVRQVRRSPRSGFIPALRPSDTPVRDLELDHDRMEPGPELDHRAHVLHPEPARLAQEAPVAVLEEPDHPQLAGAAGV